MNELQEDDVRAWGKEAREKVEMLHRQVAALTKWVEEADIGPEMLKDLAAPYYALLDEIYRDEVPFAHAVETSDLLLYYRGPAVGKETPSISLLSGIFSDVRSQVKQVTKALSGVLDKASDTAPRQKTELELGLTGFAGGSLFVGFALPQTHESLFGEDDPLFKATKEAIRVLGIVNKTIAEGYGPDEIDEALEVERIPSAPAVRDASLMALKELAPSGRKGIESLQLMGKWVPPNQKPLTPDSRKLIRLWITQPDAEEREKATLVGTVREIDLDEERLHLRRVIQEQFEDIRCTYSEKFRDVAATWLDNEVRVEGSLKRTKSGKPSLLHIEDLETL